MLREGHYEETIEVYDFDYGVRGSGVSLQWG